MLIQSVDRLRRNQLQKRQARFDQHCNAHAIQHGRQNAASQGSIDDENTKTMPKSGDILLFFLSAAN